VKTCEEDDGLARNIVAVKHSGSIFSGVSQMMLRLTVVGVYKDPRGTRLFYLDNFHGQKVKPSRRATPFSAGLQCQAQNGRRTLLDGGGGSGVFSLLLLPLHYHSSRSSTSCCRRSLFVQETIFSFLQFTKPLALQASKSTLSNFRNENGPGFFQ
jgi:hypothetical protein